MPSSHRQFLEIVEKGPIIREFILQQNDGLWILKSKALFNQIIELLHEFRSTHIHYAAHYIQKQSKSSIGNPTEIGTGGTPFMEYLRKHEQETIQNLIP